jgi:hypothetical protein
VTQGAIVQAKQNCVPGITMELISLSQLNATVTSSILAHNSLELNKDSAGNRFKMGQIRYICRSKNYALNLIKSDTI